MQLRDLFSEFSFNDDKVIPLALQQLLREPLNIAEDWQRTEQLLLAAKKVLPEQLEISMALYKMYAYSNRFEDSLAMIELVLQQAATEAGFNEDWRQLSPGDVDASPPDRFTRYYLYSMKAWGFVNLRMGNIDEAMAVLEKLLALDPGDEVGGSVVYSIAEGLIEEA